MSYLATTAQAFGVMKQCKRISMIKPTEGLPVVRINVAKIKDVQKLLEKLYGNTWGEIKNLKWYRKIINGQNNNLAGIPEGNHDNDPDSQENYIDGRIIGGEDAAIIDFPYQLSLGYFGSHSCGASIISADWLLTAAHCVYRRSASILAVRAGSSIRNSGGTLHYFEKVIIHQDYDDDYLANDIAVIKVNTSFEFGPSVQPVALPIQNETLTPGTLVVVTGWGSTNQASAEALSQSKVLRKVEVAVVDDETCHRELSNYTFYPSMICAGVEQGGKDACMGDSGGPMVAEGKLYGVVSWGPEKCAEPRQPGASIGFNGSRLCGASIISDDWVVTAAHCVYGFDTKSRTVRVGTSQRGSGGMVHQVITAITHPDYNYTTLNYDIALLQVGESFENSDNVRSVDLPEQDEVVPAGTLAVVTGWGQNASDGYDSNVLQEVEVPVVSEEECQQDYLGEDAITPIMICAGYHEGGKDACQGDSGGPLAASGTLIGIVSSGEGCAEPNKPGVYTRVSALIDWIEIQIGG
uniref:Peptidase S1 domain-containing protein n=1 Tax=Timema monikensis TaxID=170555 RepID=A0A7R9E0A1_9NEOP|nr:unnamed protein product [Timema monikensis]